MKRSIPILVYHHVSPDREVTPEGFERQLRFLLSQGYTSLSMGDLLLRIQGDIPLEEPSFLVTFDDGYLDNWVYAFPILQKLGVKATLYVVTERVESVASPRVPCLPLDTRTQERCAGGFISWSEARAMATSGLVEVGSHTHTHRHFVRKNPYENLEHELRESKQWIEKEVGPCHHLAWPWGDYETVWWPLLKKVGYQTAVTTLAGANTVGTSPYALKRFKVGREDLSWLAQRFQWQSRAWAATSFGLFYGWDRRLKTWWNSESPYSHG